MDEVVFTTGMRRASNLKHVVALAALLMLPSVAFAGLSYRFETTTTGLAARSMSGDVEVEAGRARVNIEHGDGAAFADHSFALSSGDGRLLTVVDPASRTYYEIDAGNFGGGGALLAQLRSLLDLKVTGARATSRDLGAGPTLEGYPTRHYLLETSCGIAMTGEKGPAITYSTALESWSTDRIPAAYATALLTRDLRSGLPEVDRLIAAQAPAAPGFPLKQVLTTRLVQNGNPIEVRAITTIRAIRSRPILASRFAIPPGFTKTQNPIERLMGAVGK